MNRTSWEEVYVRDSKWLLHEAFCLDAEAAIFHPYEKHHSTVKDACQTAARLGVQNLILYHTEDKDLAHRRQRYHAEGCQYYQENLYIPDDLDVIREPIKQLKSIRFKLETQKEAVAICIFELTPKLLDQKS